jgi:CBS domain-containing protein
MSRRELRTEKLKALGHHDPVLVQCGTSIGEAISAIQANAGDCLLVCSGDRLVGILTERDILLKVLARGVEPDELVDVYMTRDPDTLTPESTVVEALQMMERGGYRNIPLKGADGHIEGVLRQQDILEFVAEAFPQEILNLPPRPHQIMDQPDGA